MMCDDTHISGFNLHDYTLFLFSWSLGKNQSEERYATGWGVWSGLPVFVCFSADFGRITRYRVELTSVAKYILQPSEVAQARLAMAERWNVTTLNCSDTNISYRCQTATEGFGWRLSPPRCFGWLLHVQRRSSFMRKETRHSKMSTERFDDAVIDSSTWEDTCNMAAACSDFTHG
jgi:hypothetical protein